MSEAFPAILLDTCAVIWLANRGPLPPTVLTAIVHARRNNGIHVSPVSAWEIGMLATKRRGHATLRFLPDASTWFDRVMNAPGIRLAQFTPSIAMTASFLPGDLHNDPADRLLVSTARHLGMPIVTGDRKIIAYAEQGYVKVLPC